MLHVVAWHGGEPVAKPAHARTSDSGRDQGGSDLKGSAQILLRAAVAALLNEATFGDLYPPRATVQQVVADTNTALVGSRDAMLTLATEFDHWNNGVH